MGWELINAEAEALFGVRSSVPTMAARQALQPGCLVGLVFQIHRPRGVREECLWVELVERPAHRVYVGVLACDSEFEQQLCRGSRVAFGTEHIASYLELPPAH